MTQMTTDHFEHSSDLLRGLAQLRWASTSAVKGATRGDRLGPGGWLGFRTGHWEVTREVAERFGFSPGAVAVLKDAAQDPDFYQFRVPAAHAQTPDAAADAEDDREARSARAQDAYLDWVLGWVREVRAKGGRQALYYLGYVLHGIEDLAPHAGMTNGEHRFLGSTPDTDPVSFELARSYAERFLRAMVDVLGRPAFDALRSWSGDSTVPKVEKAKWLGVDGWDIDDGFGEYLNAQWEPRKDRPIRWPVEVVFGRILAGLAALPRGEGIVEGEAAEEDREVSSEPSFAPLAPAPTQVTEAEWTVMVYMAGDDANPHGIEYAVRQDLMELKAVGSTERVHLLAQSDEARESNSYRYRLRRDTALESDRLMVFEGDLNTGRVKTLVEFVAWARTSFPAKRYMLVLWGHGSGTDDCDVYRLGRGRVSPRIAAQLASKQLGFFGGTRRAVVERFGAHRGYGFDSTARDFLDNVELENALAEIHRVLEQPVDVLAFDACLMSMIEVAYQIRAHATYMVASQFPEPGDGYAYTSALRPLLEDAALDAQALARHLVTDYGAHYPEQTLSCLRLDHVAALGQALEAATTGLAPGNFQRARALALDCLTRQRSGYRDIGTFLEALGDAGRAARAALDQVVLERSGEPSGLSVYLPSEYWPDEPGGTDQLYERMSFARECGWAALLRRVYPARRARASRPEPRPVARSGTLYALDVHTVCEATRSGDHPAFWSDRTRREALSPELIEAARGSAAGVPAKPNLRIWIVPGIMGSTLSDRRGHHGLCWLDPVGLAAGCDFTTLKLDRSGARDADRSVGIQPVSAIPVLYDRLALALIAEFGPVVEYAPYDWRRSITWNAVVLRRRIRSAAAPPTMLVAHSMGGLVAATALRDDTLGVKGLVALGTPWLGSCAAAQHLWGQSAKLRAFAALSALRLDELVGVVRTFWGLSDLLPDDPRVLRHELLPSGILGDRDSAEHRLASLGSVRRAPPEGLPTLAVFADHEPTAVPCGGGERLEFDEAPGDGTVSALSATAAGAIEARRRVAADHAKLPLDADAIRETIGFIARQLNHAPRLDDAILRAPAAAKSQGQAGFARGASARDRLLEELGGPGDSSISVERLLELMPLA